MQEDKEVVVFHNLSTGHRDFIPVTVPFIEGNHIGTVMKLEQILGWK